MKKLVLTAAMFAVLGTGSVFAQAKLKEYKAGHVFYVSLPEYMNKTFGLNDAAVIQFSDSTGDAAGFVIEDNKEELALAEMSFASITEFYESFIKDFLVDQPKRTVAQPVSKTVGAVKFVESEASYYDEESKTEIYYFVGIAETKDAYYKVLCFCTKPEKAKFKADFQKILYSLRD